MVRREGGFIEWDCGLEGLSQYMYIEILGGRDSCEMRAVVQEHVAEWGSASEVPADGRHRAFPSAFNSFNCGLSDLLGRSNMLIDVHSPLFHILLLRKYHSIPLSQD